MSHTSATKQDQETSVVPYTLNGLCLHMQTSVIWEKFFLFAGQEHECFCEDLR